MSRLPSYFSVETTSGDVIEAENVVVATPADVSARLLGLEEIKAPIGAHLFLVRGVLRQPWARATCSLFPEGDDVCGIARQANGRVVFCTISGDPDFERCFSSWEIVEQHHWDPAFYLEGTTLLACEQGPGLYLIGDHNVSNLEDAYITGVYAANRIAVESRTKRVPSVVAPLTEPSDRGSPGATEQSGPLSTQVRLSNQGE